jgi:hypothetical protein
MNIFQITQEQAQIISFLEENGGEATQEVMDALQITRDAFNKKAEAYAYVILKLESEVDVIAAEIKRLQELKKSKDNSAARLRESLTQAMLVFADEDNKGIRRYSTPTINLSTRRSESVSIDDEKVIDSRFLVTKHEISKSMISEAIKNGLEVNGASLKTKYSVQIK